MTILARVLVLGSALFLGACHESVTAPESLTGRWSGSADGRTLRLDLTYATGTGTLYGVPVETRTLRYTGTFSDATLGYSGSVDEATSIGVSSDLHPFTLDYIASVATDTAGYWFFYKGEQTGSSEITGWLYRGTTRYTEGGAAALDSSRLALRRE